MANRLPKDCSGHRRAQHSTAHHGCQHDAREVGVTSLPTALEGDLHSSHPQMTAHLGLFCCPHQRKSGWSRVSQVEDNPSYGRLVRFRE